MAIIKCPECKKEVSDEANRCPNCGFEINRPSSGFFEIIFKGLFILLNILIIIAIVQLLIVIGESTNSINQIIDTKNETIGIGIAILIFINIWIVGNIILGSFVLFTRPKS